ncbi:hypothetical protein K1T71_013112 [Dendrolimus kikuchii]|uniref:Uncharacterized protein n=1 Tax=Dendrolimus kikuchii TaxID=765133 RepID=A0ACC1CJC7_9NEOP|nr:hypothetical protein K1T71_013112 [Dendrolimus kikuchii]
MVGISVDCPERDRVLKLMEQKDRIEHEIKEQSDILAANNVGFSEPLVDIEGYPRNDIDIYKVRHARHRIICLQNDHKQIMHLIEKGLEEVNAYIKGITTNGYGDAQMPTSSSSEQTICRRVEEVKIPEYQPFATVTAVQGASPADLAGICIDDELIQFGTVNHTNFTDRRQIFDVASHSVNQKVNVRVKRGDNIINLTVVPQISPQTALLGIQINYIEKA